MRVNGKAILGLMALGLTLSAADAGAVTRCANPTGAAPCLKLNDAIDASGPGDTVSVYAGTYTGSALYRGGSPFGYVEVGESKDGLKILGSGVVVIDVEFKTGYDYDAIDIYSQFVTVSNLTIRNGGYGIYGYYANGLNLSNIRMQGNNYGCVYLEYSDFVSVKSSKCIASGGTGVYSLYSDFLTVTGNSLSQVNYGVDVLYGHSPNISTNTVLNAYNHSIHLYGDDRTSGGTIKSNTVLNTDYGGVYVEYQNGVNIASNKISNTYYSGVYVYYGEAPIITSNIITDSYDFGIKVYGAAAQIKSNTITGAYDSGVYVDSGYTDADGAVISLNKITLYPDVEAGIENYGSHVTISSNTITNSYYGIETYDSYPRVLSNVITNTQSTGIYASCGSCKGGLIQLNTVNNVGKGNDGFDIYAYNAEGGALHVLSNTVNRANYDCFNLMGYTNGTAPVSINAVGNKGFDCGQSQNNGNGFTLTQFANWSAQSGITLSGNLVQRVAGDGYYVRARGAKLTANTADSAGQDGFDVQAGGVTLTNNKATNNAAVGFEFGSLDEPQTNFLSFFTYIAESSLTVTGNVATGNAVGACIAGNMTGATTINPAANTFGVPAIPADCSVAEGYIGN